MNFTVTYIAQCKVKIKIFAVPTVCCSQQNKQNLEEMNVTVLHFKAVCSKMEENHKQ